MLRCCASAAVVLELAWCGCRDLEEFYRRAIAANPRYAYILREFPAFVPAYEKCATAFPMSICALRCVMVCVPLTLDHDCACCRFGFDYHAPKPITDAAELSAAMSQAAKNAAIASAAATPAGLAGASSSVGL